ncbi:MAG: ATP-grasp enzyme [Verrucomicrobiota bacterium]
MSKSLQLARAFAGAGHRVILTEIEKYRHSAHRHSFAVDRFVALPDPKSDPAGYADTMLQIFEEEQAAFLVPVSSPFGSSPDAAVGTRLREGARAIHYSPELTQLLDDKEKFCAEVSRLGLPGPEVKRITSPRDVLEHNFAEGRRYLLKSINYDSIHRLERPVLPWPGMESHIESLPISEESPWVLQEFLEGDEFCTHTVAHDGVIRLHGCSQSSPFQVNYDHVDHPAIEEWVTKFVAAHQLTGQISFDFIVDAAGVPRPVECNPRTHTAVTMFHDHPQLAHAYLEPSVTPDPEGTPIIYPLSDSKPTYWLGHEIWRFLGSRRNDQRREVMARLRNGIDGVFRKRDPLPFLFLYHWQIPMLLLKSLLRGGRWLKIDFNIGKLVEPDGD